MSDGGPKKRKSKGWYRKQAYHNKRMKEDGRPGHRLVAGLKGFIITCNDHERDAVKESYNILNEYADKLYGPETKDKDKAGSESDGDDIETAIAKEVQSLKDAATTGDRRFQNSQSGAKNCIFIKTNLEDPVGLAHAIFSDLLQTKVPKSRHALRLLPVVGTCKANLKDMTDLAKVVLEPFFTDTQAEISYAINFKARNNSGIGREMTISTLRDTISDTFSSVPLCFTSVNPQLTIMVEVMCGVACLAVAKDFARFRKYNLVEVVSDRQTPTVTKKPEESAAKPEDTPTAETEEARPDLEETKSHQEQEMEAKPDLEETKSHQDQEMEEAKPDLEKTKSHQDQEMEEAKPDLEETKSHQEQETSETGEKLDSSVDCSTPVSTSMQTQDVENETPASTQQEHSRTEAPAKENIVAENQSVSQENRECSANPALQDTEVSSQG